MIQKAGNSNVGEILKHLQPVIDISSNIIDKVAPYAIVAWTTIINIYNFLPVDVIWALFGLTLAFFGGSYVLAIAAIETFYITGWESFKTSFQFLKQNFDNLWAKSKQDDLEDLDKDGVADVLQISAKQLFTRKVAFFFANCSEPQKVMDMFYSILTSILGVMTVLRVDFAKTIALGATIGENLRKPAAYFLVPIASTTLPAKYHQWIAPAINFLCNSVAISIAWFIQRIISSVQTAIRGGLMFSRRILYFLNQKGFIQFNDEDSYLDELLGWTVAFFGVYFQLTSYFGVPFPLNILLLPLSVVETYLSWIVSN